ncbi:MAG: RNA polymerase sigma factor RpoS, partial [Cycloclasticus sp.]|nr:RNA polymerase sigma factor RpoS [Cycloclasticus sp.]
IVADEKGSDPSVLLQDDDVVEHIEEWLGELEEKQKEVVVRRFGLQNYPRMTLEQVGKEMGVTRERVRQIQMKALQSLRSILENEGMSASVLLH